MIPPFAKSCLLSRLRLRAGARVVRAWALLLAIALVASGFLAVAAPLAITVPQNVAASGGHCADHATPADAAQEQHATHAGACCDALCTCACTHAMASVPTLALRVAAPAVRTAVFGPPSVRATLAAPPLRPPIA